MLTSDDPQVSRSAHEAPARRGPLRLVLVLVLVLGAVVAPLAIFLCQRAELVRLQEGVAKRDAFCHVQRFMLSSLRDRIDAGLARLSATPSREDVAQLATSNRMFSRFRSVDQVLRLCGTYDEATLRTLEDGRACWEHGRLPTCFREAARLVVRDMAR